MSLLSAGRDATVAVELRVLSHAIFPADDFHASGADAHDPSVVLVNGTYIMVATSGHEFVPLWTSKDRLNWHAEGPILSQSPEWLRKLIPQHQSIWAPAPLWVDGSLRVYCCASQKFGSNTSYIGMVENDHFDLHHPTQGWVDRGLLIQSESGKDNVNAIDPDVMVGPDGRHWMAYGSYWGGMFEVEINPQTGLLAHPEKAPLHVASNPDERGNPLEAPVLRYHDGYYYLMVTYGLAAQGVRSTYRTVVGRSQQPQGPFVGFDGKPMNEGGHTDLLKSSPPMFGPGGGNLFQDEKGDWWMAYHYYDSTRHWIRDMWGKPTFQVRRVVWGADGWPLPGLPTGCELVAAHTQSDSLIGKWLVQVDFSDPAELEFLPNGNALSGNQTGRWKQEGHSLIIEWPKADSPADHWVDSLVLDDTCQFYAGRNQTGAVIRGVKRDAKIRKL